MLHKVKIICFLLLCCCWIQETSAIEPVYPGTQYWVSPTGSDIGPGTETSPFLTISAAILRAGVSSVINLYPGTYSGNKNTHLAIERGLLIQSTTNNPDDVIIDCTGDFNNINDCFKIATRYPVTFSAFTIRSAGYACIAYFASESNNIYYNDNMKFIDCNNGIYSSVASITVQISNSLFSKTPTSAYGMGIYCNEGGFFVIDSTFEYNNSDWDGAAIYTKTGNCVINLNNVAMKNIRLDGEYGAIYNYYGIINAKDSSFSSSILQSSKAMIKSYYGIVNIENSQFDGISGYSALYMYGSNLNFENSVIRNCSGTAGAAIFGDSSDLTLLNSNIDSITSTQGAIYLDSDSRLTARSSIISNCNSSSYGGAIVAESEATISNFNTTFTSNSQISSTGSSIYCAGAYLHSYDSHYMVHPLCSNQ